MSDRVTPPGQPYSMDNLSGTRLYIGGELIQASFARSADRWRA